MIKTSETKFKFQAKLEIAKAWFLTLGFSKKPETPIFQWVVVTTPLAAEKAALFYLTLFSTLGASCKPTVEIFLSLLQQLKFVEVMFLSAVAIKLLQQSLWNELV